MITEKNKEEIEKIKKEIKDYDKKCKKIINRTNFEEKGSYIYELRLRLQERIKTSIQWCEDEIKFLQRLDILKRYTNCDACSLGDEWVTDRLYKIGEHLTYLKEQEKEL